MGAFSFFHSARAMQKIRPNRKERKKLIIGTTRDQMRPRIIEECRPASIPIGVQTWPGFIAAVAGGVLFYDSGHDSVPADR
jgi:hypothetical protein